MSGCCWYAGGPIGPGPGNLGYPPNPGICGGCPSLPPPKPGNTFGLMYMDAGQGIGPPPVTWRNVFKATAAARGLKSGLPGVRYGTPYGFGTGLPRRRLGMGPGAGPMMPSCCGPCWWEKPDGSWKSIADWGAKACCAKDNGYGM
jgi:hypothetical protein